MQVMKINWSYLPKQFDKGNTEKILELLGEFLPTGDLTLGAPVQEFEKRFAELIGSKFAIGVNSGTDAIKLSLKALGVGPGDEVITTANTFIATVGAIGELFATPVFVDCTDNFCMDVKQVEQKISDKTKAILPVHYAGQMTDMPRLNEIASKYNIPIVEDSCQCILGNIDGIAAGTTGKTGAFSLHPLKNLNVWGDGGMIVTNDADLDKSLRLLRNHGLENRDDVAILGCNSRLDSVQAVVGNWLIDEVPAITSKRIQNAGYLDSKLSKIPQITLPTRWDNRKLVFHLYIVFAEQRDELYEFCKQEGIPAKIHYPTPVYRQRALSAFGYKEGDFPVTDRHSKTMISFPAHDHMEQDELEYIVRKVSEFYSV
jgi:dTDP-3-amino-2,3,6-trideoxy-4-keto-D-glucose/dTDP-3-amino-3,4,6-trideoxy-alpha-D-glucose/dTDP-2,6-dideoxy-D-kanosamine transaminase